MARILSFVLFVVGAGALFGAAWWLTHRAPAAAEEESARGFSLSVTLAEVRRDDVEPRVTVTAAVRAQRQSELAFLVSGKLSRLGVEAGDRVAAGQELAVLEDTDQRVALRLAQAGEQRAQRRLELLLAGTRPESVRRLEADVAVAEADVAHARKEVERGEQLAVDRFLSASELGLLVASRDAAEGRLRAAQEALAEARAGTREEDLAVQRAELDLERARVESAQAELEKTVLVAPFDGHVVARRADVGETLAAGAPVFELVDLDRLEVVLDIPAHVAPRLPNGARVVVDPGAGAPPVETRLTTLIVAAEEESRNFRGLVRLAGEQAASAGLRPGTFARATAYLEPLRGVLVVPPDALRTVRDGTVVVRAAPSPDGEGAGLSAQWVPVRLLGVDPDGAAIEALDGQLAAGERVVVTGVDLAFPGAPLSPRGEVESPAAVASSAPEAVE